MRTIKKISILLTVLMIFYAAFSAAACVREQGGTYTYEELMAKFEGEIERNAVIRVLDSQMAVESGHLNEMMAAFNTKYAEYNVRAIDANMGQYVDLERNGPDGYGPDVLHQANDMLMRYAENQHILPLPMDKFEGVDKIPEDISNAYIKKTYGLDLYYGMPVALQSTVLTYRKDLLPENWKTTWDKNNNNIPDMVENINDLYKYSNQVKNAAGNKYGLYMSLEDQFFNTGYMLSYGAYIFGDTSEDIGLNAEGAEIGLNLFRDLSSALGAECISQDPTTQVSTYLTNSAGTVFATIGTPDWLTIFQRELAKTYRAQGKSAAEAEQMAKENLVVVGPPRLPKDGNIKKDLTDIEEETFSAVSMGGVNAFAISAYTKYPKASLAFLQFVSEYGNLKTRVDALGAVPARSDIADEYQGISKVLNDRAVAGDIYMMPSTRDTMYIWPSLASLFQDIATDNTTRQSPVYTTPDALKNALNKLVADIKSAMEISKSL